MNTTVTNTSLKINETVNDSNFHFDIPQNWIEEGDDLSTIEKMINISKKLSYMAWDENNKDALEEIHKTLSKWYDHFFNIPLDCRDTVTWPSSNYAAQKYFENKILTHEVAKVDESILDTIPTDGEEYVSWLRRQISDHPARLHPYYSTYLRDHASLEDLQDFLLQETTLDPRFDDVLAMMQVGTSGQTKMEMAQNFWDEMGNGEDAMVHSSMFTTVLNAAGVDPKDRKDDMYLESNICGNLSVFMAMHRSNFYKAVGYFGVTEYLAPSRFKHVLSAWERLNLAPEDIEYHRLHIRIDTVHANAWFNKVVLPLVNSCPSNGRDIAIGAFIRLNTSGNYLDRLLKEAKLRS